MRKGETTRQSILERAGQLASQIGLEGVTIGRLADELGLSKSGLFAHFRSKEELQIQVLDYERERFVEQVVQPTIAAPAGSADVDPRLTPDGSIIVFASNRVGSGFDLYMAERSCP